MTKRIGKYVRYEYNETMWLLMCLLISAVKNSHSETGIDNAKFRKCCPKFQSLLKVTDFVQFECLDSESFENSYNVTLMPLVVTSDAVEYGIPENCSTLEMSSSDSNAGFETATDFCYDKLALEVSNGIFKQSLVSLVCIQDKIDRKVKSQQKVNHIRKCCPKGQSYDTEYHACRRKENERNEWLKSLVAENHDHIYDIHVGLTCKNNEYSVELHEPTFTISINGQDLNYISKNGGDGRVVEEEWCVDDTHSTVGLVARVCTKNCQEYDAFCFRKCCPLGQHYKPLRCGTLKSRCVPNHDDDALFNVSSYLNPLQNEYDEVFDVIGLRTGLTCPSWKYGLNRSSSTDHHSLTRAGLIAGRNLDPHAYCLEAFDFRGCPRDEDVMVSAIVCFIEPPPKNFYIAAVTNSISAAALAITLVVYCALPELSNLHGKTVICHVGTMLLAYSCLARVQFNQVNNNKLCISLGYGIYFGFVAAFVWLNVMCFDIWRTFGSIRKAHMRKSGAERRRFIWYSVYAWGVTLTFTVVMFLFDKYPVSKILDADMGNNVCWFGTNQNSVDDWPHYIFFVIPMGLMTCVNLILWLLTSRHCARVKSEVHRLQSGSVGDRAKKRFRIDRANYALTGKLWIVMGAGWFSELFSTLTTQPWWLWMIIDQINQLQGLFIFLILVFKPKVYRLILKRLGLARPDAQQNGAASSSGRTSSTFLSRTISSDERTNLRVSLPNDVKKA